MSSIIVPLRSKRKAFFASVIGNIKEKAVLGNGTIPMNIPLMNRDSSCRGSLKISLGKLNEYWPIRRSSVSTAMLSKGNFSMDQGGFDQRHFSCPKIFLSQEFKN